MKSSFMFGAASALVGMSVHALGPDLPKAFAQDQQVAVATAPEQGANQSPEPLSEEELEILVARIALYPDELVALISAASLYTVQIVEAARYLERVKTTPELKPKDSWDGSVVSLLNYPQIVTMMNDDLDWTQAFGSAIVNQQKDVLVAIQQLRDKAVANEVIKTDEKIKVVEEGDNIVIESASVDTVYIPQYEPAMLYEPGYPVTPISYYADPYPYYYWPTAPYFAAFATGAAFAAFVDWDDWGVWGGDWDGGDLDIDCNNCFNDRDFNGKVNWGDVDWNNIDRSKINFDRGQLNNIDRSQIRNSIASNNRNDIRNKAADARGPGAAGRQGGASRGNDVRKSTLDGLKSGPAGDRSGAARPGGRSSAGQAGARTGRGSAAQSSTRSRPSQGSRTSGRPKPAARADTRPRRPSGLGEVRSGRTAKSHSNRGHKSMGGGSRGGGRSASGGGGRSRSSGGRSGGRGGGRR